jgi:spermidine synthase
MATLLLLSAFAVATCGLVYELLAGTLASYLLGDSVTQFSTIIGTYLFAMGAGSWATRYLHRDLLATFARIEVVVGVVGGCSVLLLFWAYGEVVHFRVALYGVVFLIGALVGAEIPLLLRILDSEFEFKDVIARVFAADYVGALLASLLFPLFLVPHVGLVRTGFLFGAVNVAVAMVLLWRLPRTPALVATRAAALLGLVGLMSGFAVGDRAQAFAEASQYPGQVIYANSTPYQRVVLTSVAGEIELFLNGNLQFSGRDEYRYHEALVHPAMTQVADPRRVLILGGGDGLAAREVLRYPRVEQVQLVDLDPGVTQLFAKTPWLRRLNGDALNSPKLRVTNVDAFEWLRATRLAFDVIIIDFPDPSNFSVGKLYTTSFYREVARVLAPGGVVVVQATSPFVARRAYWCVVRTLEADGYATRPYHALVPSFGDWGFVLATRDPWRDSAELPAGLRFLDHTTLGGLYAFPPDSGPIPVLPNRLNDQVLVRYFEEEWSRYLGT